MMRKVPKIGPKAIQKVLKEWIFTCEAERIANKMTEAQYVIAVSSDSQPLEDEEGE